MAEGFKNVKREYKGSAVSFQIAHPSPVLMDYVDFYYQAEVTIPENNSSHINVHSVLLPVESVEMIFCYHDTTARFNSGKKNSISPCHIIGTHDLKSKCIVDDISKTNKSFYVRFKPGGFSKLFGIRQNEIKNNIFTADEVMNSHGRWLENQVNNSASLEERVKAIESFFIQRLRSMINKRIIVVSGRSKVDNTLIAMQLINAKKGRLKVQDIAKHLNIPERTLNWNFSNFIGLSPKEIISLSRFKSFLLNLSGNKEIDWIELAQSCGYYDQSHLINEFKSVTGITPYFYLKNLGKTFTKCTNKLFFIESSAIDSLKEYSDDLMKIEKTASQ